MMTMTTIHLRHLTFWKVLKLMNSSIHVCPAISPPCLFTSEAIIAENLCIILIIYHKYKYVWLFGHHPIASILSLLCLTATKCIIKLNSEGSEGEIMKEDSFSLNMIIGR